MASEIKVDTISEKTSAGGVTIDGLLIKDGGISGDVSLIGTTPTFTIGDAGAEDAALVFDGNAQDYYIALDDSADDLLIGLGSTVGTTPAIAIDENLKVNIPVTTASTSASTGSLTTGGGAGIGADLYVGDDVYLITDSAVLGFGADKDTTLTHTDGTGLTLNSTNKLCFNDASQYIQGSSNAILALGATDEIDLTATAVDLNGTLDVSGNSQFSGTITVGVDNTGLDVKLFGATSGSYMLWDESVDDLNLIASGLGVVSAKDLGTGIHVRTSDSGASVHADAGELVLEAGGAHVGLSMLCDTNMKGTIYFGDSGDNDIGKIDYNHSGDSMQFTTAATERMRLDGGGKMLIGTTSTNLVAGNTAGIAFGTNESGTDSVGGAQFSRDGGMAVAINRLSDDGALQVLYQAGSLEGTISVSGSTVAYGTFCGTHWSRLSDNSKPTILRGTVMESIATMMDWYQAASDVAESTDGDGNVTPAHQVKENVTLPDGKSVGDSVTFTSGGEEYTGVYVKEDNEQLPMCKISNTADSKAVYGVFMAWDDTDDGLDGDVNDMNIASLGAFVVRVHSGETVAIGDYLQSKGDGTAKVQADDIMRASTIAKVTSTTKTITHGDGSYCVPCTLHCG